MSKEKKTLTPYGSSISDRDFEHIQIEKQNNSNFFKSIKFNTALLFIIVTLVPIIILSTISIYTMKTSLEETTIDNYKILSNKLSNEIISEINKYKEQIKVLAENPVIINAIINANKISVEKKYNEMDIKTLENIFNPLANSLENDITARNFIKNYVNKISAISEIFFTNKYGFNVECSNRTSDFVQSDEKWWQEAFKNDLSIDDIEFDASAKTMGFSMAKAIIDPNNKEIIGVIKVFFDFTSVSKNIADIKLGKTGNAYLVNNKNLMISEYRFSKELKEQDFLKADTSILNIKVDTDVIKVAKEKKNGHLKYKDFRGIEVLSYYKYIQEKDWILLIEEEISEINDILFDSVLVFIIVAIILLIIVIILALIFSIRISSPISKIVEYFKKISKGNLEDDFNLNSFDEINKLTESIKEVIKIEKEIEVMANDLSNGNLDIHLEKRSQEDKLIPALNNIVTTMKDFSHDVNDLVEAATIGKLNKRADINNYSGKYQELLASINKIIEVLSGHLDSFPIPILIADTNNKILFMNKTGLMIKQKSIDEIIGRDISDIYNIIKNHNNDSKEHLNKIAARTGKTVTNNIFIDADGIQIEANFNSTPLFDNEGKVISVLDFFINQTDIVNARKKAEKISNFQKNEITILNNIFNKMANGDLTVSYNVVNTDRDVNDVYNDFSLISQTLNETLDSLNDILGQVNSGAEHITSASSEVANNSQSLAGGASEQAASLQEVSASLTELDSQTKRNSENAITANTNSKEAKDKAVNGNKLMNQMLGAMREIQDSSTNISRIIKVIDEIAFQTNILSLNAAVEAARAGKHGKGFAVVAEEVRNLAQRSAKAAKETTELIENSAIKVNNGTKISNETAKYLDEIVNSVSLVSNLVDNIEKSSNEQKIGISEISKALIQIENVTQSTAASAEESASASEELSSQAIQLKNMIKKFKLK